MQSKKVVIRNKIGLHARPAALFVQIANKFESDIFVEKKQAKINAKSIMGVMALGVSQGDEIVLYAKGEDEEEAITELEDLIINKLEI